MYVEPDSRIVLLTECPLDPHYRNTIYWKNKGEQSTYFLGLQKRSFYRQSYQSVTKGVVRIGDRFDDIYDVNYMMFQNTHYGDKWWYAFVTKLEYVSDAMTNVYFEIDVMQTWFFDYSLQHCYIAREHTNTDPLFGNLLPEPVELGEYTPVTYETVGPSAKYECCVVMQIVDTGESTTEGVLVNRVYNGCEYWIFRFNDVSGINNKISQYVQKPDAIVAMFMCPIMAFGYDSMNDIVLGGQAWTDGQSVVAQWINVTMAGLTEDSKLDGYKPRNKKLLSYPYTYFGLDNGSGSSLILRYELSDYVNHLIQLRITGNMLQPVQLKVEPVNYKNSGSNALHTEYLTLQEYPMCSWSTDAYKAWVAQNSVPLQLQTASRAVNTITSVVSNPVGAIGSAFDMVTDLMSKNYTASIQADIVKGNATAGNVNCANNVQRFYGGQYSILYQQAAMIDNFFDVYGYTVNRVDVPIRLNNRPYWKYTKTIGCAIKGSLPADDEQKICEIFDKGITFWRYPYYVGDYSLDNTVD